MLSNQPLIEQGLAILRRRWWYFLLPFLVSAVVATGVVLALPKTYISTGKIGVESQQIPEDFVRSTITTLAGERVGMMQARVMTPSRMEDIVERLGLYSEDWGSVAMSSLAEKLEYDTVIEVISDPYASRLGAIAFTVAFDTPIPRRHKPWPPNSSNFFLRRM